MTLRNAHHHPILKRSYKRWSEELGHIRDKTQHLGKNMPIHWVIGPHKSGKKSMLDQLDKTTPLYQSSLETPTSSWWHDEHQIYFVVDTPLGEKERLSENAHCFEALLMCLKKKGFLKRMQSIKLLFPAHAIPTSPKADASFEHLQQALHTIQTYVEYLPVLALITQADKIQGFAEFFEDQNNQDPPIVQISALEQHYTLTPFLEPLYQRMLSRIRQHLLPTLQRNSDQQRLQSIYSLPNQMAALYHPLKARLECLHLTGSTPLQALRFVSTHSENHCLDFTQNPPLLTTRTTLCLNESIFLKGALTARGLNAPRHQKRHHKIGLWGLCIIITLSMLVLAWQQGHMLYQWHQDDTHQTHTSLWHRLAFLKQQQQKLTEQQHSLMAHSMLSGLIEGKLERMTPATLRLAIAEDLKAQMQSTVMRWDQRWQAWYLYKQFNQPNNNSHPLYQSWLKQTWQPHFNSKQRKIIEQYYFDQEKKHPKVALDRHAIDAFKTHFQTLSSDQGLHTIEQALQQAGITPRKQDMATWCNIFPQKMQKKCQRQMKSDLEYAYLTHYQTTLNQLKQAMSDQPFKQSLMQLQLLSQGQHPIFNAIAQAKPFCQAHHETNCRDMLQLEQYLQSEAFRQHTDALLALTLQSVEDQSGQRAFEQIQGEHQALDVGERVKDMPALAPLYEKINAHYRNQIAHYLNTIWQEDVYEYYQQHIMDRYPLNPKAKAEIDLEHFKHFFGPGGILSAFSHSYLGPMILIDQDHWQWQTILTTPLAQDNQTLQSIQHAFWIQQVFFQGQHELNWHFSLIPEAMHPDVRSFDLRTHAHLYHMDHEHQKSMNFHWPSEERDPSLTIRWQDQAGSQMMVSYHGPWAWFHLLQQAHLEPSTHSEMLHATFYNQGLTMKFQLISQSKINPFMPSMIPNVKLPPLLIA